MAIFRKFFFYFFLLVGLFIWPDFCFGTEGIVINEIMYDLAGTDDKHEWIELYNNSSQRIDLTNWKLNDGDDVTKHTLNVPPKNGGQGSMFIPADGYAILADDASTFLADHPGFSGPVIDTVMSLNNTGATLKLFDKDNNEIISLTYSKEWGANGNGKSLEKINPQLTDIQSNWKESTIDGGTPGSQNSVSTEISPQEQPQEAPPVTSTGPTPTNQPPKANAGQDIIALVDQEITFDGSGSSDPENDPLSYFWNFGDGVTSKEIKPKHTYFYPSTYIVTLTVSDGKNSNTAIIKVSIYSQAIIISEFIPNPKEKDEENEWIEIHNQKEQMADLSGWQIKDESSQKAFVFPESSLIGPKQYLVIKRSTSKISLNNDKDTLFLLYPTGDICQEIKYEKAKEGNSVNFISGNQYVWSSTPTPGMPNIVTFPETKPKTSEIKFLEKSVEVTEFKKEGSSWFLEKLTFLVIQPETKPNQFLSLLPQPVIAQVTEPTSQQLSEAPLEKPASLKEKISDQKISNPLAAALGARINQTQLDFILIMAIIISAGLLGVWLARIRKISRGQAS